jgi:threonine synthase
MKFISTRLKANIINFEEVVLQGLASDGGLYIPDFLPQFDENKLNDLRKLNYQDLFFEVTRHFVEGEINQQDYKKIIAKSYQNFNHPAIAPLKQIGDKHFLLELFHGPTLAFKDFALQFLGNLLDYLLNARKQKAVVIGATSGDTGSAAIQGCMSCENLQIFILHPHQKVSEVQRRQMTSVIADNVFNLAIDGNFDDCQAMVKKMFGDESFLKGKKMIAVNSINFARIMAQIVYYFFSALRLGCNKKNPVSFSVPSGNFGDIYAGYLAKRMGLNINKLIIATNNNDILTRFIKDNDYSKKEMIETISPSMNIQVASNFERLIFDEYRSLKQEAQVADLMHEFERTKKLNISTEVHNKIKKDFLAYAINDDKTKKTIANYFKLTNEILDPHSAIGVEASDQYLSSEEYQNEIVITLATAHPAKFEQAVIDSGLAKPQLPLFLSDLFHKKERFEIIQNNLNSVKEFITKNI